MLNEYCGAEGAEKLLTEHRDEVSTIIEKNLKGTNEVLEGTGPLDEKSIEGITEGGDLGNHLRNLAEKYA